MIFYKCNCGLITNEMFKRCPSCGVESKKIKEEYTLYKSNTVDIKEYLSEENIKSLKEK
jgi:hypothetical protein